MKFYLSHPIRGEKAEEATVEELQKNNSAAIDVANYIHEHLTVAVDIHVPAEMESFVEIGLRTGILSIDQVLAVDKKIIEGCDAVLIFAPFGNVVKGCKVEFDHALKCQKPVFVFKDAPTAVKMIADFVLRS